MLYDSYQAIAETSLPPRVFASYAEKLFKLWEPGAFSPPFERMAAYYELVTMAGFTHSRPEYGIDVIATPAGERQIDEAVVFSTPFCDLMKFSKRGSAGEPKVLRMFFQSVM